MSYTAAIHQPCPDLPHHSLNAEQKIQGLSRIARVKEQLKESQLSGLRHERQQLKHEYEQTDSPREQSRIVKQINNIDAKAIRISERWS